MSHRDTFKTYNPVTLTLGIGFLAGGFWLVAILLLHGARTAIGGVVIILFAVLPFSLGATIVHNQLRLRKLAK